MIDSHAHILNEYYDNIHEIYEECLKNNIIFIMNCATNLKESVEVINLNKKYSKLIPAIGIHPENVKENNIQELEKLVKNNKIYAIGEIGLDYYWVKDNKEEQKELFEKQIDLANKYNLPVIVHSRESIQDCFDILKIKKAKGVIHCFTGSYEMAKEFIKIGFKLGIGGVLTFKNSKLYEVIEKINLDDIVLETDSPYMTPEPFRGKKNNPQNVFYVAKKIADLKNISLEEVIKKTTENAIHLFDI